MPDPRDTAARAVDAAHRREWAFVLAATVRVAGGLDLAEECVQEAYLAALDTWTRQGVPRNPGAWLTTTARRRAVDAHRRAGVLRAKLPLLVEPDTEEPMEPDTIPDDRLRLVFTCCHPALALDAQVALTLRLVCGLTTVEIAEAFLVSESTMAARVTRAKKKIAGARIPYRVPAGAELADRLHAVLVVVHLLFTTGHTAPAGAALVRVDLVERAVGLARMLLALMPDEPEARGLLALLLLTDARRATRVDDAGRVVLLADQDRRRWDRAAIDEGVALVVTAMRGRRGRFTLQAAIAALHAEAPSYAETDWPQLLRLYDLLAAAWPSAVVELNRAVALAMVAGPEAALARVDELVADGRLTGYRYLPATRADLLRRLGRQAEAAAEYRAAITLCANDAEREFLSDRLAELDVAG
ncbi:MAG TPA: sigma-70 family RNA polymerase sigma factor [Pseudonocardiaceae bacterium]|nr:sigma-70 family RNA polymerase sigma factor [Pseudonocardiaceae bacterium]